MKQTASYKDFAPGFVGLCLNPFYIVRKSLYKNIRELAHHVSGRVLDVGCGQKPYQTLFNFSEYIGMDIEQSGHDHTREDIDVFYDGKTFPFSDSTFDSVLCNQVLEHVFNPEEFLSEITRVLKSNGILLLTVPFIWDEHEQPFDYARYSSFGLKHLFEKHGMEVIDQRKSCHDVRVFFQLINAYLFKAIPGWTKKPIVRVAVKLLFYAPNNILGEFLSPILPKNPDLYLDNIIVAKKIKQYA